MQKEFKLSPAQLQELSVARKSFNAIIDYQMKTHPEKADYLPQKAAVVKDLAKEIDSQGDYEHMLASLRSLKGKTNLLTTEGGVTAIEYTFEQTQRDEARAEAVKAERASELDLEKYPNIVVRANLEKAKPANLRRMSLKQFEKYSKAKKRQAKSKYINAAEERYKQNLILAIERSWGDMGKIFKVIVKRKPAGAISLAVLNSGYNIEDVYDDDFIAGQQSELFTILNEANLLTEDEVEQLMAYFEDTIKEKAVKEQEIREQYSWMNAVEG